MKATKPKTGFIKCITLLAVAAALTGCSLFNSGGGESQDRFSSGGPTAETGQQQPPLAKDAAILTVGVTDNYYAPKSYNQNLPVWQEVERNTGVRIQWDVAPATHYQSSMRVRLAAGVGLPDIVQLPDSPASLGMDGLILPLNDLIEQHAPHIRAFLKDNPDILKLMKAPDGNIYALSNVMSGTEYTDPSGLLLRKDWLDAVGLKEPTTIDEWYTVLKAFKEGDPNGNGQADEIPFSPRYSWGGIAEVFGHAMGLHLAGYCRGFYIGENGSVQYGWLDPRAEELVVRMNKWYEEGLIDAEFMTKSADKILADIALERIGSTNHLLNATAKFNAATNNENANWVLALPPGEDDETRFYEKAGMISSYYSITKDAADPVLAIRWLDYIYASEEGSRLLAFGVEGLSYTMVDGKPQFTDFVSNNSDGLDPVDALRSIGAFPSLPWIRGDRPPYSDQPMALLNLNPIMVEQAKRVKPFLIDVPPLRFILASEEEDSEESKLRVEIETFVEESVLKFIYGTEPIDWPAFTNQLKKLGIDRLLAIKQQQYDRYLNS